MSFPSHLPRYGRGDAAAPAVDTNPNPLEPGPGRPAQPVPVPATSSRPVPVDAPGRDPALDKTLSHDELGLEYVAEETVYPAEPSIPRDMPFASGQPFGDVVLGADAAEAVIEASLALAAKSEELRELLTTTGLNIARVDRRPERRLRPAAALAAVVALGAEAVKQKVAKTSVRDLGPLVEAVRRALDTETPSEAHVVKAEAERLERERIVAEAQAERAAEERAARELAEAEAAVDAEAAAERAKRVEQKLVAMRGRAS